MRAILLAGLMLGTSSASLAQADGAPLPLAVSRIDAQPARAVLPANTEVLLAMNQEVTTKGDTWEEGDTFDLSVVHDVTFGDYVVIPKGSRAVGKITWLTSKGAFGKSGKMDISLDYIDIGGRRIPIAGTYRQEGEGNTVATVGGVILAGVFAGFITGKSGRIPQGRELMARTRDDIPLAIEGPVQVAQPLIVKPAAPLTVTTTPVSAEPAAQGLDAKVIPAAEEVLSDAAAPS